MLLGSNIFSSSVRLKGVEHQLGDLVRAAFSKSGLTIEEWNALSEREREHKLVDAYYDMR